MGWNRSLTRSFARALRAQCSEAGGAWTQALPASGRRRSPGEQHKQCPPSSRPLLFPLGGFRGSPGGTRRATCPHLLRPAAAADSAASFGGPVAELSPPAVSSFLLTGPSSGLCHGILSWGPLPYHPSLDLRLGKRVGILAASAAPVPSRGKFISGVGAGHSSIHSLPDGTGVGVTRTRRESAPIHGVWGPALSLMRVCLSSASRCVPNPSARLARSLRPRVSR